MTVTPTDPTTPATSGGKPDLKKWNWGAFLWTWIWAIGHGRWGMGLLWLVVSIFIPIVPNVYFGLKGNELAWETGRYQTYEELRASQRRWAWWALIIFGGFIALGILIAILASAGSA